MKHYVVSLECILFKGFFELLENENKAPGVLISFILRTYLNLSNWLCICPSLFVYDPGPFCNVQ